MNPAYVTGQRNGKNFSRPGIKTLGAERAKQSGCVNLTTTELKKGNTLNQLETAALKGQ
jgi:hypothetical protein